MNIQKLSKKPKVFERLLGLSPQQFEALITQLEPIWRKADYQRKTRSPRQRAFGGGRKLKLSFPELLAMYLLYTRTYTNHMFLGLLFGIDDSRVCRYFSKLQPVLYLVMKKITIKKIHLSEDEIKQLIADATEQETERRPGSGYSGKKKRQTVKTQIVVDTAGSIQHISRSVPGNIHDKKLLDHTPIQLPSATLVDLGYLGTELSLPFQSSKLHPLTQRFRNRLDTYNQIFVIVAGLYNFKRL